ncbi:stage 0 sporulation protein F [Pontibacillus chungwhensis BH030062]|uniref:Stage 0 sporulation protein F n=1 Tax=Pontibacillus chungwhensis BH030062 TaxID=1385513 RepID=A0A0A2UW08_9BACI|nr:response regulator [Pontibacillus chungwhensis]KGP92472.1 stage 0 sporulation protein F [Pontibacillus chungwhensis BH030062]
MTKTVLVVDDQPGIRMLLREVIKTLEYNVIEAKTGQEAVDFVKEQHPDLMLLDYKLPIKDGLEVLNELQSEDYQVPAILMSGLAEDDLQGAHTHSLVKSVVGKPFDVQKIREIILNILQ